MPDGLEGCLCLLEDGRQKLFGGERSDGSLSDEVWVYDHMSDTWIRGGTLPFPVRDLFGCRTVHTWYHREQSSNGEQHDEFVIFGGGWDGAAERGEVYRFYTR